MSLLYEVRVQIPNWLLRGKPVCHTRIVTLRLAFQHISGRFLACRAVSIPAPPARELASLPVGQGALASVPKYVGRAGQGRGLPSYVVREFEDYLNCGRLEHGFLRVQCESCHHEKLVAFSCKRRGFCPSCGARRMADSAAHLVDEVFPKRQIRQWVLSVPFPLRFLFATNPQVMSRVLTIVHRVISTFLIKRSGRTVKSSAQSGAVTLIQRFGSALNLNLHFHMLYLDGIYDSKGYFWPVKPPTKEDLGYITHTIAKRVSRYLERAGYLCRDAESEYLDLMPEEDDAMHGIISASITYRLARIPERKP